MIFMSIQPSIRITLKAHKIIGCHLEHCHTLSTHNLQMIDKKIWPSHDYQQHLSSMIISKLLLKHTFLLMLYILINLSTQEKCSYKFIKESTFCTHISSKILISKHSLLSLKSNSKIIKTLCFILKQNQNHITMFLMYKNFSRTVIITLYLHLLILSNKMLFKQINLLSLRSFLKIMFLAKNSKMLYLPNIVKLLFTIHKSKSRFYKLPGSWKITEWKITTLTFCTLNLHGMEIITWYLMIDCCQFIFLIKIYLWQMKHQQII